MSYQPIELDRQTPSVVKNFVRNHVEMQLGDVHCMLRLPILEYNLGAGCNFAAANSLLAIVSGLAVLLTTNLSTERKSKSLFTQILDRYYPWDLQPPKGSEKSRAIYHLYKYFRNPLIHSLGLKPEGNFLVRIAKNALSEEDIEKLEVSQSSLGPAIIYRSIKLNNELIEEITLDIANFYWGVRELLRRLSVDSGQMSKTEKTLKSFGLI